MATVVAWLVRVLLCSDAAITDAGVVRSVVNDSVLLQDEAGLIIGAEVRDNLSGKSVAVYAKQVINATGPFTDTLRQMSDPTKASIIMPSAGLPLLLSQLRAHAYSSSTLQQ